MKYFFASLLLIVGMSASAQTTYLNCEAAFGTTLYISFYEEGRAFLSWGNKDFPNGGDLFRNAQVTYDPQKDLHHLVFEDGQVIAESYLIRREALSGRALGIYSNGVKERFNCVRVQ